MVRSTYMTKEYLERLSKLRIRRGFEKWIPKTVEYFNILNDTVITEQVATKLVQFINGSNSKYGESYWILRKKMSYMEYNSKLKSLQAEFITSSYKNTNRRAVQHKFQMKNFSRGYSGYVVLNNKQYYCRSKSEFIYLMFMVMEQYTDTQYRIEVEDKIFHYNDESYKPDIFVYTNEILTHIYEVKSNLNDLVDKNSKYNHFKPYFEKLNISFNYLGESSKILTEYPYINDKMEYWIATAVENHKNMKGKNNPNYGNKYTQLQKDNAQRGKIIGQLTKYIDHFKCDANSFDDIDNIISKMKKVKHVNISTTMVRKYYTDFNKLKQELNENIKNK